MTEETKRMTIIVLAGDDVKPVDILVKKGLTVEDALQTEAIVSMFPSDTGEGLGSYSLSLQGTTDFLARDFDLFTLDEGTKLEAVMGAELGFCCN